MPIRDEFQRGRSSTVVLKVLSERRIRASSLTIKDRADVRSIVEASLARSKACQLPTMVAAGLPASDEVRRALVAEDIDVLEEDQRACLRSCNERAGINQSLTKLATAKRERAMDFARDLGSGQNAHRSVV